MQLARDAAGEGYDVVVAFGGDGTLNEAANGLRGSGVPLVPLPGGSTNVFCRMLGIPNDVVDATEHVLRLADRWRPRAVDLGRLGDRWFTFGAGMGLDAAVVARIDARPELKARYGSWSFAAGGVVTFARHYVVRPPQLALTVDGREVLGGISLFVQNGTPFTYFRDRPVEIAAGPRLDSGTLGGGVLNRGRVTDLPPVIFRALSRRAPVADARAVTPFAGARDVVSRSADGRPVPVQVDGDHIGDHVEAAFDVVPGALTVVASRGGRPPRRAGPPRPPRARGTSRGGR
jgi:diacylglycerol kinase family enzyme